MMHQDDRPLKPSPRPSVAQPDRDEALGKIGDIPSEHDDTRQKGQHITVAADMVPHLIPNPAFSTREINLEAEEWRILTLVNGKNTVGQIAGRSGLSIEQTCQIIAHLLDYGLIEERNRQLAQKPPRIPQDLEVGMELKGRVTAITLYDRAGELWYSLIVPDILYSPRGETGSSP